MQKLSWEEVQQAADELAEKIKASAFQPDCIIGITSGGLIPLYFLVKSLKVETVFTVSAKSYEEEGEKKVEISYLPETDLKHKKVLLVDEITESGTSLKAIADAICNKYEPSELKTATLGVNKDKCQFYPDFYVLIEQGEWIVFPWEKEDFPEYSVE
ncbi:MAG: phosphoribosyltransferase family protein [Candidatus Gracilibacteria bacterium]|nr:phosphoribosyltransferase family protein [Candidatus Gracilibacteria bacterium]